MPLWTRSEESVAQLQRILRTKKCSGEKQDQRFIRLANSEVELLLKVTDDCEAAMVVENMINLYS